MSNFMFLLGMMSAISLTLLIAMASNALWRISRAGTLGAASFALGLMLFLALGLGVIPSLENFAGAQESSSGSALDSGDAATSPKVAESAKLAAPADDLEIQPRIVIPPGRPEWVEQKPSRAGEKHTQVVCSDPYRDSTAARVALDDKLVTSVQDYVAEQLGSRMAGTLIHYDLAAIKQQFVKSQYEETIEVASLNTPMHQIHAQVEFGPSFRQELAARWQKIQAAGRLGKLGVVVVGLLLLLSTVFGYFRTDNATRGYYTGRLQLFSAAAILAVVAAGVVLARSDAVDWMRAAASWEHHVSAHDCSGPDRCPAHRPHSPR